MSTLDELRKMEPQIRQIAKRRGAYNLRVFGSVARGEDGPQSDIDLLAEFEKGRSLFDLVDLKDDMEKLCGREVDVLTPDSLHRVIKDRVLSEAVPLLQETRA